MSDKTPEAVASNAELGPLPEPWRAGDLEPDMQVYTADACWFYAARAVAAERALYEQVCEQYDVAAAEIAKMQAELSTYFSLADASWVEICQEAAKHGITSMPILPGQAKALDQYNKLRALFGPNP